MSTSTPTPEILGNSPQGFSDPLKQSALHLKARILSGEYVPIDELVGFISMASVDLTKTVKAKAKKEIQTDVDFF